MTEWDTTTKRCVIVVTTMGKKWVIVFLIIKRIFTDKKYFHKRYSR